MSLFAEVHHGDTEGLVTLLGLILVFGCLLGAAYCAYLRNFLGTGLLLVVAIVAAYLLLA